MIEKQPPESPNGTVRIERLYAAPLERVWAAISAPAQMVRWMSAPCERLQEDGFAAEVRVGGSLRIAMILADGEKAALTGSYEVVEPPRRLAFSWSWDGDAEWAVRDTRVEIVLEPRGAQTLLTLTHAGFTQTDACESHTIGWGLALDALGPVVGDS